MSTYILMKILESTPDRYDRGIQILTLGSVDMAYDRLISHIKEDQRVLDIGCGTGALTLRAAQKGAKVMGIDINSQMLEIAQKRAFEANLTENIELSEMGVAELENERSESYDVVISGLCFSELTEDELRYTLRQVKRILKPNGLILFADEVRPEGILKKALYWLIRIPLVVITYIITQTTTHAVRNLPQKMERIGFKIESVRLNKMESFIEITGRNIKG